MSERFDFRKITEDAARKTGRDPSSPFSYDSILGHPVHSENKGHIDIKTPKSENSESDKIDVEGQVMNDSSESDTSRKSISESDISDKKFAVQNNKNILNEEERYDKDDDFDIPEDVSSDENTSVSLIDDDLDVSSDDTESNSYGNDERMHEDIDSAIMIMPDDKTLFEKDDPSERYIDESKDGFKKDESDYVGYDKSNNKISSVKKSVPAKLNAEARSKKINEATDDDFEKSTLKDFPRDIASYVKNLFPDASTMTNALAAYVYLKEGKPSELPVPEKIKDISKTYQGELITREDAKREIVGKIDGLRADIRYMKDKLETLELAVSYLICNQLDFCSKEHQGSPSDVRFAESHVNELMKQLDEQFRRYKERKLHQEGIPKR